MNHMFFPNTTRARLCPDCGGRKIDRRNRKFPCRVCRGDGMRECCNVCLEAMPCSGRPDGLMECTNPSKVPIKNPMNDYD